MTVEQLSTSNISSTCPTGVNYISKYARDLREKSHEVWTRNSNRSRCTAKKMTGGGHKGPPPMGLGLMDINTKSTQKKGGKMVLWRAGGPMFISWMHVIHLNTACLNLTDILHGTVRAPVFDRHQFFGTSEHYGKAHGSFLSGWMNYNYTACCWFSTSSNILILPSQFWQIRFESYWLHCSKCRILVL